ncbi:hypothetical protein [Haloarchaeobius sp. HME9146]|uniref:hypothetical protein n=1 Tax=Haloarchaeobius sp. HME9146 TaxID=2978732 RepID=UPI0021BEBDDA|nr:hypothetical protein [Haloarchaeobius sp. HME9146]MCT9096407.1 hypothetical protein [Haloarchaeobius sp. HME9146]
MSSETDRIESATGVTRRGALKRGALTAGGLLGATAFAGTATARRNSSLTIATRNLYLGGNLLDVITSLNPETAASTLLAEIADVRPFSERAKAIAEELVMADPESPQLVGLQEVSLFEFTPSDGSESFVIDHLTLLTDALAADGVPYQVAAVNWNADVTIPVEYQGVAGTLRFRDRDAILVRADVARRIKAKHTESGTYDAQVPIPIFIDGRLQIFYANFGWVKVRYDGVDVFNTHLDVTAGVRELQALELLDVMGRNDTILIGDINSDPSDAGFNAYEILRADRFDDAYFDATDAHDPTCTFSEDLTSGTLDRQIDVVFHRGRSPRSGFSAVSGYRTGLTQTVDLSGLEPAVPSPIYPSDHAGVVVTLEHE